jgi:hypothetical protein
VDFDGLSGSWRNGIDICDSYKFTHGANPSLGPSGRRNRDNRRPIGNLIST